MTSPSAPLYPELPTALEPAYPSGQQQFRLSEITRLKTYLETEAKTREHLRKKYGRGIAACHGVDGALTVACMGLGCAGVGLLATIIAAPIAVGLEAAALACGVFGVAAKFIERRLAAKAQKHDEIRVLALAKVNTIATHVSKALSDGEVSDEEFRIIMEEVAKYEDLKAAIRVTGRAVHAAVSLREIDEETKNALLQRGRDEARASMIKALGDASAQPNVPVGTAPAPRR